MKPIAGVLLLFAAPFAAGSTSVADVAGPGRPALVSVVNPTEITPARLSAALFLETNRVRRAHGCQPLRPLPELAAAADDQATYMALTLHAVHESGFYRQRTVVDRVQRRGLKPAAVAENVASQPALRDGQPADCSSIAASLVEAWMNSPGHRANLLNREFTHVGCAARLAPGFGHIEYVFGAQVFSKILPPELNL
ncbi:MAG: SCP-like extracellular [Verrucomicrobia bacterium]|nr:SCP-like extracellular [Verrucomicrobiota bacterium]